VTDTSGCQSEITRVITISDNPQAAFDYVVSPNGFPLRVEFDNNTENAQFYLWNFGVGDTVTSSLINPSLIYPEEGTYLVTLTASNIPGCSDTVFQMVEVLMPSDTIDDGMFVQPPFPNPTTGMVTIPVILDESAQIQFALLGVEGGLILQQDFPQAQEGLNEFLLDLSSFRQGIYLLRVRYKQSEVLRKIFKQ